MPTALLAATVATAGWAIARASADRFPEEGGGLQRYAARFAGVEINSTFYRSHRPSTFERWAETTPDGFRFALKLPRTITHEARLLNATALVARFRTEVRPLRGKLGPLLVQLPPSLAFDAALARTFFTDLRDLWPETIVLEPRHPSWFESEPEDLLDEFRVARVAADPARHPAGGAPGGWRGARYWRLHGSPRMYVSSYAATALRALAAAVREQPTTETWCVFDNTTSGAATANALALQAALSAP